MGLVQREPCANGNCHHDPCSTCGDGFREGVKNPIIDMSTNGVIPCSQPKYMYVYKFNPKITYFIAKCDFQYQIIRFRPL